MPIVFVHGVNNRRDSAYEDNEAGRNGFIQQIVAPALGLPKEGTSIRSPYWGGDGVKFAWNMAVLPDADDDAESFGGDGSSPTVGGSIGELALALGLEGSVVESARNDFRGTIEAVFGALLAGADEEPAAREIAALYQEAVDYAAQNPKPAWLNREGLQDGNFADTLNFEISKANHEAESFGAGGLLDQLREGVRRLGNAIPDVGTGLLVRLGRKKLNATASLFLGDAFIYLTNRGTPSQPGPIVNSVLQQLRAASEAQGEKLVVIAHSFGGEIMYDIATHFAPEITVDVLITVGSQVGLFEEMKLFAISRRDLPPDAPKGKVKVPENIRRWINVYDENDVLAYKAEPVFDRVTDFHYDTGYSSLEAHGGYFLQPSFYSRLAARLEE